LFRFRRLPLREPNRLLGSTAVAHSEFKKPANPFESIPSQLVLYSTTSTSPRACLRAASERTSNLSARLVFCPYTQLIGTNCTSAPFRASTHVSMRFTLVRHRSRSFRYYMCDSGPLRPTFLTRGLRTIRFLCGYGDDLLSQIATHVNSLAHGSRRMKQRWSTDLVPAFTGYHFGQLQSFLSASFTHCLVSSTFHSLSRVLFIFRSRY
jgi:hypothetical protein